VRKLPAVKRSLKHVARRVVPRFLLQSNTTMLPKKKRVTRSVFQNIMDKGSVVSGSFFILRYLKQDTPQYAVVAPKKIAKTAVKRNSLRRKGYNILRSYDLKSCAGILFYKKEALIASSIDIKKDIDLILKKAKII